MLNPTLRAPYPGVIAHHPGTNMTPGHGDAFHIGTMKQGLDASTYFELSGISELADANDGLCTFWFDENLALYQNTNKPLISDADLAPSIDTNAGFFGSFMGALCLTDPARAPKRAVVESVLGNAKFVAGLDEPIGVATRGYLAAACGQYFPLDEFALQLICHVDSLIPGVLDFRDKPLGYYLNSDKYGLITRNFFEIASEVISKVTPVSIKNIDLVVDLTRDMLEANFQSLAAAPASNIIRAQFAHLGQPFTVESIRNLSVSQLKELGTIIVATYDTTALSLLWSIAFIETSPREKQRLMHGIDVKTDPVAIASMLVLEALRLGGSNPTALWRRTLRPVTIYHRGSEIVIPKNAMLWLDRRRANKDPRVFPYPNRFDSRNIEHLMRMTGEQPASLLARNRYEINSFSMVNTDRNPRKCPGRLFSVRTQALVLVELYRNYDVMVSDVDTSLATHSSMPRPMQPGTMFIQPRG